MERRIKMATRLPKYHFKVTRTGSSVEVELDFFSLTVTMEEGDQAHFKLPNDIEVQVSREYDENSTEVFLRQGDIKSQVAFAIREISTSKILIGNITYDHRCPLQFLANQVSQTKIIVVRVLAGDFDKILPPSSTVSESKKVACCFQGMRNKESLTVVYVKNRVTNKDLVQTILAHQQVLFGQPLPSQTRDQRLTLLNSSFLSLKDAKAVLEQLPNDIWTCEKTLYQKNGSRFQGLLWSLLGIHGPKLISGVVSGRARDFLDCFEFEKKWEVSDLTWIERLKVTNRKPWAYIKKYYRVRGVDSGDHCILWGTDCTDQEFEREWSLFDSTKSKFPGFKDSDLEFLLGGQDQLFLNLRTAASEVISEQLECVLPWHNSNTKIIDSKFGWNGKFYAIDADAKNNHSELLLVSKSYSATGSNPILKSQSVSTLWTAGHFQILSEIDPRDRASLSVVHVLKEGDYAGILAAHRIVFNPGSKLIMLVSNNRGKYFVVGYDRESSTVQNQSEPHKYKVIYRGINLKNGSGLGVFVQRAP